jgi:hypothetical protein
MKPARLHASGEIEGVKSREGRAVEDELCDARRGAGQSALTGCSWAGGLAREVGMGGDGA